MTRAVADWLEDRRLGLVAWVERLPGPLQAIVIGLGLLVVFVIQAIQR